VSDPDWLENMRVGPPHDRLPEGEGPFGYAKSNPVPGDGYAYVKRLRCSDSQPFEIISRANVGDGPDGHFVDQFTIVCADTKHIVELYVDMYHPGVSSLIPDGLRFVEEATAENTRVPLSSEDLGLLAARAAVDGVMNREAGIDILVGANLGEDVRSGTQYWVEASIFVFFHLEMILVEEFPQICDAAIATGRSTLHQHFSSFFESQQEQAPSLERWTDLNDRRSASYAEAAAAAMSGKSPLALGQLAARHLANREGDAEVALKLTVFHRTFLKHIGAAFRGFKSS
jgi:hypothetical protein